MYQDLVSLIELCLVDGVISEKERNVILNKSKSLNISSEECEVIIDSIIHKHKGNSITKNEVKEESNSSKINNDQLVYYTELQDLKTLQNIIERNNQKLKEVDNLIPILFKEWKDNNLKNLIININIPNVQSGNIDYIQNLTKKGGLFNSTLEYRIRDKIYKILEQDVFIGYVTYFRRRRNYDEGHDYGHDCGLLLSDKGIYMLTSNLIDKNNVEFYSFEKPYVWIDGSGIDFNFEELIGKIDFFNDDRFQFVDEIKNSEIKLNTTSFMNVLSSSSIDENGLKNLMILINYIDRYISEHNSFILSLSKKDLGIKENQYRYRLVDNLPNISELFRYILQTISHITTLLMYRDQLFFFYRTGDMVKSFQLYNKLDDIGVFQNKFQRDLTERLSNINNSLLKINNSLIDGFESISSNLINISSNLNFLTEGLSKLNSNIEVGSFVKIIQTYQMYKINQNTKRIG